MRFCFGQGQSCFEIRPSEQKEFDRTFDCGLAAEGDIQDAALLQRGLLEDLVQLPAVAVGESGVLDARHVGVGEHLCAVGLQRLVQALGLYERDYGRVAVRRHLQEGVVGNAASGGVLGNDHRGVSGVPAEGVEERVHERCAGAYLVRADGVAVAAYALLERLDGAD